MNTFPCKVCGTPDPEKPMAFRGEDWCCDRHRKMVVGEFDWDDVPVEPGPDLSIDEFAYGFNNGKGR